MKKMFIFLLVVSLTPTCAFANDIFTFGAWVPYWRKTIAVPEIVSNINRLDYVNLFSFEIDKNGKPKDTLKIAKEPWPELISQAKNNNKKIIGTFSWFNGNEIHSVLIDKTKRSQHIEQIINMATTQNLAGIDIDYENKLAKSRNLFSDFLMDLKLKLKEKNILLYCTIEPRTPPVDQYLVVPLNLEYVNNYSVISNACDKVIIMAYDQRRIDIKLNKQKGVTEPYVPVSDNDWVKKVIALTLHDIPKEKIILGIPTYGHEYIIDKNKLGTWNYYRVGSLTYKRAMELIREKNLEYTRNSSGEMTFQYNLDRERRLGVFFDHGAIKAKIDLAYELGLSGVSLFKIDGESDSSMWNYITNK